MAERTTEAVERGDGLGNVRCPVCAKVVFELDMERYENFESGRGVVCCTDCREEFEEECHEMLDCDVLDPLTFAKLWVWSVREINA